ncbi:MAG TPA: Ig domain-containing protein [Bryobacteraceae bacterium]
MGPSANGACLKGRSKCGFEFLFVVLPLFAAFPGSAQGDPCSTLTFTASSTSIPAQGGTVTVTITAAATCSWAMSDEILPAYSSGPFILLGTGSQVNCQAYGQEPRCTGTGNRTIQLTAPPNASTKTAYGGMCVWTLNIPCIDHVITFFEAGGAGSTPPVTLACPSGSGMVGVPYSSSLTASGGVPPYTFSVAQGALPSGLTLIANTGNITGTATQAGSVTFTGKVVDSGGPPNTASQSCTIAVAPLNRVTQITATIQPTPCQTVRAAGQTRPGPVNFQSTQNTQNFNTPTTLVMLQGSTQTIALTAAQLAAGGNILFFVQRAADDNPAIGGANDLPTLTPTGAGTANLGTDQAGSFSIGAYVDVNGNGKQDSFEPAIFLNYVLAGLLKDAAINNNVPVVDSVQTNQTIAVARKPNDATTWTKMVVSSGNFNLDTPNQNAIYLNATADLVGGGPAGQRGLDRVQGGWVNNLLSTDAGGTYTDNHATTKIFASNAPANGIFVPGGAAPALVVPPLLDTGRHSPGTGGNTATLGRSRIRSRTDLARGSRIAIDAVDSPKMSFARNDPGFPASTLRAVNFGLTFNAYLALWTNATGAIGATGDAADRLYTVGLISPSDMTASWDINGAGVATTNGAPSVGSVGRTSQQNALLQAAATRMEVCSPTALRVHAKLTSIDSHRLGAMV